MHKSLYSLPKIYIIYHILSNSSQVIGIFYNIATRNFNIKIAAKNEYKMLRDLTVSQENAMN